MSCSMFAILRSNYSNVNKIEENPISSWDRDVITGSNTTNSYWPKQVDKTATISVCQQCKYHLNSISPPPFLTFDWNAKAIRLKAIKREFNQKRSSDHKGILNWEYNKEGRRVGLTQKRQLQGLVTLKSIDIISQLVFKMLANSLLSIV